MAAPKGITKRGPNRSIIMPTNGDTIVPAMKPMEKMLATVARLQPNSSKIGGNKREKNVLALTPIPRVTKAIAMTTQP